MTARLRPMLASMPAYVAGRTVPGALKLASNETSYPLLPIVAERVAAAAADVNRYPDPFSSRLRAAVAGRYGVPVGQVAIGCGSVALCQQVIQIAADAGDEVLYPWRSFEAYAVSSAVAGARSVQVPLRADQSFDLDALADAVTDRTRLVFICSPNNPTGTTVGRAELDRFLDRVPEDLLVVLDQAYWEFVDDPAVADGQSYLDRPNIVLFRTFSKAYGLAGLRVGYAVTGDPAVATALLQTQVAFAVNHLAQEAALACLEPQAEDQLLARVAEVVAERGRVTTELRALGYEVTDSHANFVWLPLGSRTMAWSDALEAESVIVRAFADAGARVTIGTRAENDVLLAAAATPAARAASR